MIASRAIKNTRIEKSGNGVYQYQWLVRYFLSGCFPKGTGKTLGLGLCLLIQISCGGSSSPDPVDNNDPIPESFTERVALVDKGYQISLDHIDVYALVGEMRRRNFSMLGLVKHSDRTVVGIDYELPAAENEIGSVATVLVDIDGFMTDPLLQRSPLDSVSLSRDLSTAAWIEECLGYTQLLSDDSEPMQINPWVRDNTCFRPAMLSSNGHTIVFGSARGETGTDGTLQYAGFDTREFGYLIVHRETSRVTSLAMSDISVDGIDGSALKPYYLGNSISEDGRLVAARVAFVPDDVANLGQIEFTSGILLINAMTGEYTFADSQRMQRAFCSKCYFYPADDMKVSGNGKYLFFLRPALEDLLDPMASSKLFRYDIEQNKVARLPVSDDIDSESLIVDRSGARVAYLAEGEPILLKLDSAERVELDSAIRMCNEPSDSASCEFVSYRFVMNSPLRFSGDGDALAIMVIPELDGIDEPQNTQEIMLLNTQTLQQIRMTPNIDVDRIALGESANPIAIQSATNGLISDDNDFDSDLFVIRR